MFETVVLNGNRVNYDGRIDYSAIADTVKVYEETDESQVLERVRGYEIVVTKELPLSAALIGAFPPSVKLICEAGTGYNNIDLAAAREKGILVTNIPAYSSQRVAHTAMMFILNLSSSMGEQLAMLHRGDRRNFERFLAVEHQEVNGKTLGVIGAGAIGKALIALAKAFEMEILVHTIDPEADEEHLRHVSLKELLEKSDFVSLHCPLTPQTRHLMGRENLSRMKPGAYLINTSRGALVDEEALVEALRAGKIAGAGLDVLEEEPPAPENPLFGFSNVILTPHMGWKGLETRQRLVALLEQNIRSYMVGTPINLVS